MTALKTLGATAAAGFVLAALAVAGARRPEATRPAAAAEAPFDAAVVGAGIVEACRGNVAIGTPVAGVVRDVVAKVGDRVSAGAPLFRIDARDLEAKLVVGRANVAQAEVTAAKPQHHLDYLVHLQERDRSAVSIETITAARDDVEAAKAALAVARATVAQDEAEIDRRSIRAPSAGRILQVNVRAGEFADAGASAHALVLLGDDTRMCLRVDVDENDAWRVRPEARAVALLRGGPKAPVALRFEYVEPYVTPKAALTGTSTERTDVRALQVIYSFERGELPVYFGQQMDARIEAAAAPR